MSKDTDSPFSPEAIAKASGRRLRDITVRQLDWAQKGPRPSDFGEHEPIAEEAMVPIPIGPDDRGTSKVIIDPSIIEEKE